MKQMVTRLPLYLTGICFLLVSAVANSNAQAGLPVASPMQAPVAAVAPQISQPSPAQVGVPMQTASQSTVPSPGAGENILIGPGDLLDITVFDTPELSRSGRVAGDGTINLPLLGNVHVVGLTEAQAAAKINEQFLSRGFLLHPQTSVLIREFAARGVTVLGEVARPGVYPLSGSRSLVDVLAIAGGLTNLADTRVTIEHADGTTDHVVESLPLDNPEIALKNDPQVSPGDRVMAARAGLVYVLGEVGRPGGYAMQYNGTITALQSMAWAGGTTHLSNEDKVYLVRRNGTSYTTKEFSIRDMYKGKTADFALQANDILYVPVSHLRNFIFSAPQIAGTIGSAAIYGVNANH